MICVQEIALPSGASYILRMLQRHGYDAYVVGGCVRDSMLGIIPNDWDICTSALPLQTKKVFSRCRVIDTGIQHGTVTIVMDDGQYEVTTFRADGNYSDHRRPDTVSFVGNISCDLARRDFTINAMAYRKGELLDPHGGISDLKNGIISCVGAADQRFQEDALRIMRALRFSSTYGFSIANKTADAIHKNKDLLRMISSERINAELCKLLCGKNVLEVLLNYSDVFAVIIPELAPCIGFVQNNRYHQYTVYDHMAHAVSNCKTNDLSVRIALFLHDIGKPSCYTEDENGGHFYGHAVPGRDIAKDVLERLRFDNKTKNEVLDLILYHDAVIEPTSKTVRRWLNKIGEDRLRQLLYVREADILAHAAGTQETRLDKCESLRSVLEDVLQQEQCFSMKDLAISGKDILSLGVPQGKRVGEILQYLLDRVICGGLPNYKEILIKEAVKMC